MRVSLINPPIAIFTSHANLPSPFYPMGLLYVAAVLEKGHHVSILDAPAEGWRNLRKITTGNGQKYYLGLEFDEIKKRIKKDSPDIVGITVPFTIGSPTAQRIASIVKEVDRKIITVMGGPHPSVRPEATLSNADVDFVVVGEGEHTMRELLCQLEKKQPSTIREVKGIAFREGDKIVFTGHRKKLQDLDGLPFPPRHLLPIEEYFASSREGRLYRGSYIPKGARWATVITSRGCPYHCVFCSINISMGRVWRARSPGNVVQEIEQLISQYKVNHINFEDDNMTLDNARARRIFDMIIEKNLNITWSMPNGVRADTLDEDLIKKMKQSGCIQVFVAPESGDPCVLEKIIKKKIDLRRVEEAVSLFKKYGITVDANFVIGHIGETKENILKSLHFAKKLRNLGAGIAVNIAIPLYGTELYEEAVKKGYLRKEITDEDLNSTQPLIETPDFTITELLELYDQFLLANSAYDIFHLILDNPRIAIRYIFSFRLWRSLFRYVRIRLNLDSSN